jgi:hypothetical protein
MVIGPASSWLACTLLAVEESGEALIERLDPPRRAAVLMAILGLVILGLTLVACVMIGGRWVRRLARQRHGRTTLTANIENQRLRTTLGAILPAGDAGETVIAQRKSDDTTADP